MIIKKIMINVWLVLQSKDECLKRASENLF